MLDYIRRHSALSVWVAMATALLAIWLVYGTTVADAPVYHRTILRIATDIPLVLLPWWWLRPRWRWTVLPLVWGAALWAVCNLAYFRFWHLVIPPSAVTMTSNINTDLMRYGLALLHWSDLFYLLVPSAATALYLLARPWQGSTVSRRTKVLVAAMSILIFFSGQYIRVRQLHRWHMSFRQSPTWVSAVNAFYSPTAAINSHSFLEQGPVYNAVRYTQEILSVLNAPITLNAGQRNLARKFILSRREQCRPLQWPMSVNADSVNVVYIIVESLNASVLDLEVNGLEITPTLNRLARAQGTVTFDNVVNQVKEGGSSDGHIMLLSGLLPLRSGAASILFGSTVAYPSLASALPHHHAVMLLADNARHWNETDNFKALGMPTPLNLRDFTQAETALGDDGAVFAHAAAMLPTLALPFFMGIMTQGMHIPFTDPAVPMHPVLAADKSLRTGYRNYLNVTHRFDECLDSFLASLPHRTVVFIAGDHSQDDANENEIKSDTPTNCTLFMATGTGTTMHSHRTVGQGNLFPAVLQLLGVECPGGYCGMLPSALDECVDGTVDALGNTHGHPTLAQIELIDSAFTVSDLLIRANPASILPVHRAQ